jgi:hypothetical protein
MNRSGTVEGFDGKPREFKRFWQIAQPPPKQQERRPKAALLETNLILQLYNVDSISNPQASSKASGIYFEFLFLRAHSRRRVDRMY